MRRAQEPERESLSLHVTRKQGNPHSRPLTQMTIFGNLRQWNRPRARGRGGVCGSGEGPSAPPNRGGRPLPPPPPPSFLALGVLLASAQPGEQAGRGALRPPPLAPLPPPPPGPPSPASPRAPPSKVDVSESTWYRGWRIKSVELNSCHCSDSSRAEHRGSERTSERASERCSAGTEGERDADGRSGPVQERAPGKGCRSSRPSRGTGTGSGAASLSA